MSCIIMIATLPCYIATQLSMEKGVQSGRDPQRWPRSQRVNPARLLRDGETTNLYFTTRFTKRPGTTISLTTVFPSKSA